MTPTEASISYTSPNICDNIYMPEGQLNMKTATYCVCCKNYSIHYYPHPYDVYMIPVHSYMHLIQTRHIIMHK